MSLRFKNSRRVLNFESLELRCLLSATPGDFSGNGKVDAADYVLWRNADPRADSNGDTHVDHTDYVAWRSNFGNVATSSVLSVSAKDVPKTITDEGTIESHVAVIPDVSINHLKIQVNISHPYDSDLQAYLISPAGTRVQLFSGVGESGMNFQGTVFDDDAADSILDGAAPFTGTFRPSQPLSAFDSENAHGTWTLEVSDHFPGDEGTLLGWTLTIDGDPIQATGVGAAAFKENAQTSPAPVNVVKISSAPALNVSTVRPKSQSLELHAETTQSTLQPKLSDLLLTVHSFSRVGVQHLQAAAIEFEIGHRNDAALRDGVVSDELFSANFKSFDQI